MVNEFVGNSPEPDADLHSSSHQNAGERDALPQRLPMCIFLAEDDPEDRLIVREAIAESGLDCTLREFENGEALMEALIANSEGDGEESPADLIMLDLHMPRKDGMATLRELKYHPRFKKIPVIMFTSDIEARNIRDAYGIGANAYIEKISIMDQLVEFLRALSVIWGSTPERERRTVPRKKQPVPGLSFKPINILLLEDNQKAVRDTTTVFDHNHLINQVQTLSGTDMLKEHLEGAGRFADREKYPVPDLILMDLGDQDERGMETVRKLKQDARFHEIPFIGLTDAEDASLQQRAREVGIEDIEKRPFTFLTLVDLLRVISGMYLSIVKPVPEEESSADIVTS